MSFSSESLGLQFWEEDVYLGEEDEHPGEYVHLADILCHVVHSSAMIHEWRYWVTIATSATLVCVCWMCFHCYL